MTFTWKCYQNDFLINNLNIASVGDCFGSLIACMSFALLLELSRGIDLYLRHDSMNNTRNRSGLSSAISNRKRQRRRVMLHLLRTLVHLVQTALSYILMLMVMNNFAGFLLAAVIALGIGYYLLNGVHPYTHSANDSQTLRSTSDLIQSRDNLDEHHEPSRASTTRDLDHPTLTINS